MFKFIHYTNIIGNSTTQLFTMLFPSLFFIYNYFKVLASQSPFNTITVYIYYEGFCAYMLVCDQHINRTRFQKGFQLDCINHYQPTTSLILFAFYLARPQGIGKTFEVVWFSSKDLCLSERQCCVQSPSPSVCLEKINKRDININCLQMSV